MLRKNQIGAKMIRKQGAALLLCALAGGWSWGQAVEPGASEEAPPSAAVEVAEARGFAVTWHPFSLAVLNEGKDIPEDYRKHVEDARLGEGRIRQYLDLAARVTLCLQAH